MASTDSGSAALRAFAIMEMVAKADWPVSLVDAVEALRLPKPTVYRIMALLEQAGLLIREPEGKRYMVGPRLAGFGMDVVTNSVLRAPRHAILEALVEEVGETCNVTTREGNDIVYLDRVETAWPLRMHLAPGSRVPLHCTASGKLFLSQLPEKQRSRILDVLPLKRCTEKTIVDRDALERELERIRERQVGTDDEESLSGMMCVAVPIRNPDGEMCASVAVHAPVARMSLEQGLTHVPRLRRAAKALSATFFDGQTAAAGKRERAARESVASRTRRAVAKRPAKNPAKAA
jgi:IclR family transcriptional regulator, acetate operon repressor